LIKEKHSDKNDIPIQLNKDEQENFSDKCHLLKKDLINNSDELSKSHMNLIEESLVKINLYYIFFDKLSNLSNIFKDKSKYITERYKQVVNENKAKLESEILVQDKFLEFNNNIDSIVHSMDKKLSN